MKALGSIYARLLLSLLFLVLLVLSPLAWFALTTYSDSLERHYGQEVRIVASGLASAVFDPLSTGQYTTVQSIVEEIASGTGVDVAFVVDEKGKILAHTDRSQVRRVFAQTGYEADFFDFGFPVERPGSGLLAVAHAGIKRQRMQKELGPSQQTVTWLFALSVLAGIFLAVLLASHFSRPLRSLTAAARTIADGNLGLSVGIPRGPAELKEMAGAFEEMRRSLAENMERLERSYAQLDRKVRDLSLLYEVSEAMNEGDYSEGMLDRILRSAARGSGADFGLLMLQEEQDVSPPRIVTSFGVGRDEGPSGQNPHLEEVARAALSQDQTVVRKSELRRQSGGIVAVPLLVQAKTAGVLALATERTSFEPEDVEMVEVLANQAARCVERSQLYAASITDGLTSLYVSRYFRHRIVEEMKSAKRYQRPLCVMMVDIDFFKKVNDTYGHQAGDDVLRVVARCILQTVREGIDIACRYGGEEFAVILPETDKDGAVTVAERLRVLIEEQVVSSGGDDIQVTVSIGLSSFPEDSEEIRDLIEKADQALYKAKRSGRNQVVTA